MKKILLAFAFMWAANAAFAQPCTPNPNWNRTGINPARLADAEVGIPYDQTITFVVPLDTLFSFNGSDVPARIDSAHIMTIHGYPAGFNYEGNNPRLTWPGGSKGCAKLTGNATESQIGDYAIWVKVQAWVSVIGAPGLGQFEYIDSSLVDFKVIAATSVHKFAIKQQIQSFPNPVKDLLSIDLPSYSNQVTTKFFDVLGNTFSLEPTHNNGLQFSTAALKSGVYFAEITDGKYIYTTKFIKE